jgi:exopolyphosphatase/guanosine-5'-triphosphate,3'-diphosphate pyrophosphatase
VSEATAGSQAGRIAAIDVGTNSIRLIVAEASPDGSYKVLDDEKETARLGQGLAGSGALAPAAMERTAVTIARMRSIALGYGVGLVRAIGTYAARVASNREEFVALVQRRAGVAIEPISAEEEARLAHVSVSRAFDLRGQAVAVVDIGGGSTEVVLSSGGVIEKTYSLPLGAVLLSEQFGAAECSGPTYRKMRRDIRRRIREVVADPPFTPSTIIGTGGTFTSLAHISLRRGPSADGRPGPLPVRGYEMARSEVSHLAEWLREMPLRTRMRVPGLSADRADIIVAGAAIVDGIMRHLGVNRLKVHDRGVRDGLLLTMVGALFPDAEKTSAAPPDRARAVRQFAASCGYEERHCAHVARVAGQVFDELARRFPGPQGGWSEPDARGVLEAAALLHDVGYLVNYSRHHQHTYHLIAHSGLPGFTPREIELIANVARYHRRGKPKMKHPPFASLPKRDRDLVKRLAAILRIADGLDRNRMQNVRAVALRIQADAVTFVLDAGDDPAVDIWGAERKARLFQDVFGLKPRFRWKGAARAAHAARRSHVHESQA